jgi:hypothetical protein
MQGNGEEEENAPPRFPIYPSNHIVTNQRTCCSNCPPSPSACPRQEKRLPDKSQFSVKKQERPNHQRNSFGSSAIFPPRRPAAFRPVLTGGLAFRERLLCLVYAGKRRARREYTPTFPYIPFKPLFPKYVKSLWKETMKHDEKDLFCMKTTIRLMGRNQLV